uniref:Fatty acid desaturase domain-containing protein n=1 Tax=Trieres chinensis TaxID=1514140 RepID=A0A7S2EMX2_TRICV|mmetsp:Transcript_31431/g.64285  ORF Transcript_31431/g.64285 Transcript_31431/m.64285 type:complete len:534 (+) Transcript_31431:1441-3042(+)
MSIGNEVPGVRPFRRRRIRRSARAANAGAGAGAGVSGAGGAANPTAAERPYPWNLVSDRHQFAAGCVILVAIFVPTISLIVLSTVSGYALYYGLHKYNPPVRAVLDAARAAQRWFFRQVGEAILLDPRDSPYLAWMTASLVTLPPLIKWAYERHADRGFEVSTFLIYHLLRLGPRYRFFAHHECLIHTEGHASKTGFFRNVLNLKAREPVPKWLRRLLFDHINGAVIGPFFGSIPHHYATAHNKIHHRWHNDTGDVHTNMDVDRTDPSSFVLWLPRFILYWTGVSPAVLFWKRGESALLRGLLCGMAYYYALGALVWRTTGTTFWLAYFVYPQLEAASFLGGIAYIWHAFSEESDPSNQYVNSITIVRGHDNIWNEDFHVVHHHEPNVHWTEMPASFRENVMKYVENRATVFGDCEQGVFFAWMFGAKWDDMVDHFVDLNYAFSDGGKNYDVDKLMTVKQIFRRERELCAASGGDAEAAERRLEQFRARLKDMLLRRLRYHYMGDRGEEWKKYNDRLNAGVRDFEKEEVGKQS